MLRQVLNRFIVERGQAMGKQRGAPIRHDGREQHRRRHGAVEHCIAPQGRIERHRHGVRGYLNADGLARVQLRRELREIDAEVRQLPHALRRLFVIGDLDAERPVFLAKLQPHQIQEVLEARAIVLRRHRQRDAGGARLDRRERGLEPGHAVHVARQQRGLAVAFGALAFACVVKDAHELREKLRTIGRRLDSKRARHRNGPARNRNVLTDSGVRRGGGRRGEPCRNHQCRDPHAQLTVAQRSRRRS